MAHGTTPQLRKDSAEVLNANGVCSTHLVKKVVLREGLIPYMCERCHNEGTWGGEPLVLRLDHKNGIRNDHRIENLRFLCPNCDSQTSTFCGRNKRKASRVTHGEP